MKLYKAIKSTLEVIGLSVCIFIICAYFDGSAEMKYLFISFGISLFLVWFTDKVFYRQAMNGEVLICPWCGGITPQSEDINFRGTRFDAITSLTLDGFGKFLMDYGLACVRGEEPKDVFKWLEEQAEE